MRAFNTWDDRINGKVRPATESRTLASGERFVVEAFDCRVVSRGVRLAVYRDGHDAEICLNEHEINRIIKAIREAREFGKASTVKADYLRSVTIKQTEDDTNEFQIALDGWYFYGKRTRVIRVRISRNELKSLATALEGRLSVFKYRHAAYLERKRLKRR